LPPNEGERDQHSEDEGKDGYLGEDFEDDLDRGENETEPSVEESLKEYEQQLDENEQPGNKNGREDTTYKDETEDEDELSTEDKMQKQEEDTEEFSREDAGENDRTEQCLDEYDKTLDSSAVNNNDGDEEKNTDPQETGTNEGYQKTDEDPPTHEVDVVTEVKPDAGEDEELASKEFPEEGGEKDEIGRYIAEYDESLATTATDPSERTEIVEIEQADTIAHENTTEYRPITLEEDPQAFVREDRETLVEEGRLQEKDELQLDDNTALRFDVNEGLTVIHDEQRYEISTVEHQSIGDLDFYRYKTEQGEEFLHIPEQDKAGPPYETHWYALPSNTEIYLDREYKHELLQAALDKAGGEASLRRDLEEMGTHVGSGYMYRHLHDQQDGTGSEKVISVLAYLARDLDEPTSHITAIGHCRAIENPNLPFSMDNRDGARLLAARFSDGTNCAPEGRGPRFDYANNNAEQRNRIVESLENVFGGANILNREYDNGEVPKVRTSTDIIGYVLERAGAVTGSIMERNPDVPIWIQQGSIELKHEWLVQAFGDEGSTWPQRGLATLTRCVDATPVLTDEQRNQLDLLKEGWSRKPPTEGWEGEHIRYCRFGDLPEDIQLLLSTYPPRLLNTEQDMLRQDFGVDCNMYSTEIYERKDGYGVTWVLQTKSRADSEKFYEEIGFPQSEKQDKLRKMLRLEDDKD
jgi:hypothetical protein